MNNIPNKITAGRLVLAAVFFVLVSFDNKTALLWAETIFIIACITDFLDGYLARRLNQATAFGRVADPFVDKVIVCGAFVLLANRVDSVIVPWMVVVLISREFLVSSIRGYAESQGVAFGAEMTGKIKAVVQMVAIGFIIYYMAFQDLLIFGESGGKVVCVIAVYLALALTVVSAVTYVLKAWKAFAVPPSSQ